jgi:hypothetical protein
MSAEGEIGAQILHTGILAAIIVIPSEARDLTAQRSSLHFVQGRL